MTVSRHRTVDGRPRPQPRRRGCPRPRGTGWLAGRGGHLAGFAARIQARHAVTRRPAGRTSRVLLGRFPANVTQLSHHEHLHLHPVPPRPGMIRQARPGQRQRATPELRQPGRVPAPEAARARLAPARPRLVPGTPQLAPITATPPARTVRRPASGLPATSRRPGVRTAPVPAARFTARIAPAPPVIAVLRRPTPAPAAQPPPRTAAPAGGVPGNALPARPPGAPPEQPVVAASPGRPPAAPLDLDFVTGEVLRRIERRAIAQRERRGRGAF